MASPDPYKEKGPHRGPFSYLQFICNLFVANPQWTIEQLLFAACQNPR